MGANGEAGSNTVAEEEDLGAMIVWLKELPAEDKLVSSALGWKGEGFFFWEIQNPHHGLHRGTQIFP